MRPGDLRRPEIAVVLPRRLIEPVLSEEALSKLQGFAEVRLPALDESVSLNDQAPGLMAGVDGCLMGWGSPRLDGSLLDVAPGLRILAYAAGSVRGVVSPELYDRGIVVTSAAAANADEVAAYALGAILCAAKGVFPASRAVRTGEWGHFSPLRDLSGCTVGIIGAGHIGRRVLSLLSALPNSPRILLHDPLVSAAEAECLGATLVDLDQLLGEADIVSLHAPSVPGTRHMLNAKNLPRLRDHATLINTARGSLVDPDALAAELRRRPTLQAILDVTDPTEPPPPGHPFRKLENVVLTPHLAGVVGPGRARMGDLAVEELYRYFVTREPALYPVTRAMLDFVA